MRRIGIRLGQLALTVVVTWLILTRVGVDVDALRGVDATVWTPQPLMLAASCLVLLAGYVLSAGLWGTIVADLGGPKLSLPTSVRVFMVANLGRYIPGKVWQVAGLALLAKGKGVPASIATGAAVLGQGVALLAAALLGVGALFGPNEVWRRFGWLGLGGGVAVAVIIVSLVTVPSLFQRVIRFWFRLTSTPPPDESESGGKAGRRWLLLYLLNWGVYATAFWLLYLSLGEWRTFMQIGPAFAAAYVAGYVALFAPAGAGIREGFLVVLLQPSMSTETAVVVALAARVWTTAVELLPAALFAATLARSTDQKEETS